MIEKVWRRGPFSRIREKERGKVSRGSCKDEAKAVEIRKSGKGQGRRGEAYEPTNYVYVWEMGVKRRKWERVEEYFGVMSEYERAGGNGCNAKYGAEILREI